EYWQGAWGVITQGAPTLSQALTAPTFWSGVGPGNFGVHYLRYKLPQSSEEIQDPHNLFLEVWATAGFWAVLALAAALAFGFWNLLGPAAIPPQTEPDRSRRGQDPRAAIAPSPLEDAAPAPRRLGWLVVAAASGLVMVLVV